MANNNPWSGLTAKQDEIWNRLWDEHVPSIGRAWSTGGEILRAMSRIIYRFFNDGDLVGIGYGNETCNSSDRYLKSVVPDYVSLDGIMFEDKYEKQMLKNHHTVFAYLRKNPQLFKEDNFIDSRIPSDDDRRREREDSLNDWED